MGIDPESPVINFAHDYYFLRKIFPRNRIVTIYHDDIEAQSKFAWMGHVTRSIRLTCGMSDDVFAVSTPLVERLKAWCNPKLLLPWVVRPYRAPHTDISQRNILLHWGFIDVSIDSDRIRRLASHLAATRPEWRIMLVGPSQASSRRAAARRSQIVSQLNDLANVEILGPQPLDELPLDRVLAALIPYRRMPTMDAIEMPNKLTQLLACGLPILKSGMPAMVRQPFICAIDDDQQFESSLNLCVQQFNNWQPDIRAFLETHSGAARLKTLGVVAANSLMNPS